MGEDGERHAWRGSRSDEFPGSVLVVNAVPVAVEHEADSIVFFGFGSLGSRMPWRLYGRGP